MIPCQNQTDISNMTLTQKRRECMTSTLGRRMNDSKPANGSDLGRDNSENKHTDVLSSLLPLAALSRSYQHVSHTIPQHGRIVAFHDKISIRTAAFSGT